MIGSLLGGHIAPTPAKRDGALQFERMDVWRFVLAASSCSIQEYSRTQSVTPTGSHRFTVLLKSTLGPEANLL